jgi:hypothetical protein
MAVKHPSVLHDKDLKNQTTPDASSAVTEEKTKAVPLGEISAAVCDCVQLGQSPRTVSGSNSYYVAYKIYP